MGPASPAQLEDWSRRIKKADAAACAELFHALYPALYRYAKRFTPSHVVAEDIVQEAFYQLWRRRDAIDAAGSLRGLLYATVRNLALNENRNAARRERLLQGVDLSTHPVTPDKAVSADVLRDRMTAWIEELPARRREAFELSRLHGLSYLEIAEIMAVSVNTVDNHIRLALQHLRERLRAFEPDLLTP